MNQIMKPTAEMQQLNSWGSLPIEQKLKLVDYWDFIIIASNFCHITSILLEIFPVDESQFQTQLMGLGTFLIWITLTSYLKYDDEINVMPATVMNVSGPLLRQFASTMPIVVGLSFFCMSYFGYSWRFNNLDKSIVMLWANWQGDELQNIYHALTPISFLGATVFAYSWIWFSNNFVHNAFLAMVEDGYVKKSKEGIFSWITNDFNDPDQNKVIYDLDDDDQAENSTEQFLK